MGEILTIVCWLWRGWRPVYDSTHVNRLDRMLRKHMSIPYRLVCITDHPDGIECETFPLWNMPKTVFPPERLQQLEKKPLPNCFSRLRIFDPRVGAWFGSKILSIDLDCVILDDLAPLITDDPFKAAEGKYSHICGTLWQFKVGEHANLWSEYDPVETPKVIENHKDWRGRVLGSDQAWMSIKLPDAPVWREADGVYWARTLPRKMPNNMRYAYFAGGIKPWTRDCELLYPELYKAYMSC